MVADPVAPAPATAAVVFVLARHRRDVAGVGQRLVQAADPPLERVATALSAARRLGRPGDVVDLALERGRSTAGPGLGKRFEPVGEVLDLA